MNRYFEHYSQMNMDELRLKSKRNNKKGYSPICIDGKKIAKTWWGEKWCENLENYADYDSRLGRGKRYVRSGAVIDLQIKEGSIDALVQGSSNRPYKVNIKIAPLSDTRRKEIIEIATNKIDNLDSLASGDFPLDLSEAFLNPHQGLFPSSDEISINCNCPDWAVMCKHAAAVLYGVGAKLDEDPLMFFLLRSIDFNLFIKKSIEEKTNLMFKNLKKENPRLIPHDKARELFGF
jgi:uncharacterized Zn finger protein